MARAHKRRWLNKPTHPEQNGYIIWHHKADSRTGWIDCSLRIADCSRIISLDLDLYTASDKINTLHKLDVLIEEISELRKHVAGTTPTEEHEKNAKKTS